MNKKKTRNSHTPRNGDSAQRFADILRQTADMHRPGKMPSMLLMEHTETAEVPDDCVTVPLDEYNNLVAAKATLGLLISLEEEHTLTDYDIGKILRMMSGVTADA